MSVHYVLVFLVFFVFQDCNLIVTSYDFQIGHADARCFWPLQYCPKAHPGFHKLLEAPGRGRVSLGWVLTGWPTFLLQLTFWQMVYQCRCGVQSVVRGNQIIKNKERQYINTCILGWMLSVALCLIRGVSPCIYCLRFHLLHAEEGDHSNCKLQHAWGASSEKHIVPWRTYLHMFIACGCLCNGWQLWWQADGSPRSFKSEEATSIRSADKKLGAHPQAQAQVCQIRPYWRDGATKRAWL